MCPYFTVIVWLVFSGSLWSFDPFREFWKCSRGSLMKPSWPRQDSLGSKLALQLSHSLSLSISLFIFSSYSFFAFITGESTAVDQRFEPFNTYRDFLADDIRSLLKYSGQIHLINDLLCFVKMCLRGWSGKIRPAQPAHAAWSELPQYTNRNIHINLSTNTAS